MYVNASRTDLKLPFGPFCLWSDFCNFCNFSSEELAFNVAKSQVLTDHESMLQNSHEMARAPLLLGLLLVFCTANHGELLCSFAEQKSVEPPVFSSRVS